jgi:ATP-dependent protease ClpP protease subunit
MIEEMERLYGQKAVIQNMRIGEIVCAADEALDTLEIEIHSPGGSVFDGWRMHNAIKDMRARGVRVIAKVSLAGSMASVVAIAADEVHMAKGGRFMIHDASTVTVGTAQDHYRAAGLLDSISDEIAGAYAEKTGKGKDEMREMMLAETWLTSSQAVALGLADKEMDGGKVDAEDKVMALKDLFTKGDPDAAAKIEAMAAEIVSLESALKERDDALAAAVASVDELKAAREDGIAKVTELSARVDELQAVAAKVPELEAALAANAENISAEAQRQLAATGHQPVAVETEATQPVNVLEKLASLRGDAQRTYYKENQKAIKAALRAK